MQEPTKPSVMIVYGTRPEAIKVAPLINALKKDKRLHTVVVSTGQHREMLVQVNEMFGITPDYNLNMMHANQPLNRIMSRGIKGLDKLLAKEEPNAVVVQGDTTTAMAAAIASFNRGTKVVHLEAGLRSWNLQSPFPEEANRRLISTVTSLHLTPTKASKENLLSEGVNKEDIVVTGNTVIDALQQAKDWDTNFSNPFLRRIVSTNKRVILVTTHRRENIHAMSSIGRAIATLAVLYPEDYFVLPVHLNPLVREGLIPEVSGIENVCITDPLPYDEFTKLLDRSYLILTDSGGVQEEAPSLGKPVLVMRDTTERPEAIDAGTVRLVGARGNRIITEVQNLLDNEDEYMHMAKAINPYGDGRATIRSVAAIAQLLDVGSRIDQFQPVIAEPSAAFKASRISPRFG